MPKVKGMNRQPIKHGRYLELAHVLRLEPAAWRGHDQVMHLPRLVPVRMINTRSRSRASYAQLPFGAAVYQ